MVRANGVYTYGYIVREECLGPDSMIQGIELDSAGNLYAVGTTGCDGLTTRNAVQPRFGGGNIWFGDAFVLKLGPGAGPVNPIYKVYLPALTK